MFLFSLASANEPPPTVTSKSFNFSPEDDLQKLCNPVHTETQCLCTHRDDEDEKSNQIVFFKLYTKHKAYFYLKLAKSPDKVFPRCLDIHKNIPVIRLKYIEMSILCIVFDISFISEIHKQTGPVMDKCIHIEHVYIMITLRCSLCLAKHCIYHKQLYLTHFSKGNTS